MVSDDIFSPLRLFSENLDKNSVQLLNSAQNSMCEKEVKCKHYVDFSNHIKFDPSLFEDVLRDEKYKTLLHAFYLAYLIENKTCLIATLKPELDEYLIRT